MNLLTILDTVFHIVGVIICGIVAAEAFHDPCRVRDKTYIFISAFFGAVALLGLTTLLVK